MRTRFKWDFLYSVMTLLTYVLWIGALSELLHRCRGTHWHLLPDRVNAQCPIKDTSHGRRLSPSSAQGPQGARGVLDHGASRMREDRADQQELHRNPGAFVFSVQGR